MLGKMARSAPRPPFGLPEGAGRRRHFTSVFQGSWKSATVHTSSGVIGGNPATVVYADRYHLPEEPCWLHRNR